MAMLRFIAAFLFLAVAVVLSAAASDGFAAGKDEAMASVIVTGESDANANGAVSDCPTGAAGEQGQDRQDCCAGQQCAAATALAKPSAGPNGLGAADIYCPFANRRMIGRNVAPETGPPKLII